jgi:PKD repeat protein
MSQIPVGDVGIVDTIIMTIGFGTCQTFDTTYIYVAPIPSVEAGLDITFCEEDPNYTLTGYTPDSSGVWSGSGIVDPIAGIFSPSNPGTPTLTISQYTLTYLYTDPFTGCQNSDSLVATVNPHPLVTIFDTTICDNPIPMDITLDAPVVQTVLNPDNGSGVWSGPGIVDAVNGIFRSDSAGGVGVYSVFYTYTDGNGCTTQDTAQIVINDPLIPVAFPYDTVCAYDGQFIFDASLYTPSNDVVWIGTGVVDPIAGLYDPSIIGNTIPIGGTGVVDEIIMQYGYGTCQTFDTTYIFVAPIPAVEAGQDLTFCASEPLYNLTGNTPDSSGIWSGYGLTDVIQGIYNPNINGLFWDSTYYLYYDYVDPFTTCTNYDSLEVTVFPMPGAEFLEIPVACIDGPIQFTNTSVDPTAFFAWDFGDGSILNFAANPTHTYQDTGWYTIQLTATSLDGCIDSFSSSIYITEPPTAFFTPDTTEGCAVLPISFTNGSTGYQPTYYWDFGNGDSSTLFTPPTVFYEQGEWDTTYYVQLEVSNLCGTVYHLDSILVHPIPIVRFAPNVDTACTPHTVHFANYSVGNPGNFVWYFGDGTTSTDSVPPPVTYYTDSVETTYTVTLISTNECGADTLQRYITVLPNNVNAFFIPSTTFGCEPLTVSFDNFSSGPNVIHNWDFGDGNTSSLVEPTHTFTSPGVFPVELTVDNGCGFDSMVINITVYPEPVVDFIFNDSICEGDVVNFVNTSPGTTGQVWQFGTGDSSLLNNPSYVYNTAGTYMVYLTAYADTTGCPGYDSSLVTVLPRPTSTFTPSALDGCVPLTVNFTNTGAGADYASWTFGDGNSSAIISPTHTFTTPGTYTVCLVNTSINTCVSDTTCIQIVVHPKPVSAFTPVITDTCGLPLTVDFINQSSGAISYFWDFSNGSTSLLNNPTTMYQDTGIHVIGMIAINQYNCADTSYQAIRAFENPVADFTYTPAHGCEPPLPVSFTNTSLYYNSSLWDFGNGGSVQDSPTHPYNVLGAYTVSLIVGYDGICFDTVTVVDAVQVTPNPVADFTPIINDTCGVPLTVDFINNSTGAVDYDWYFSDNTIDSIFEPTHLFNAAGYYDITMVAYTSFGCTDTSIQTIRAIADPIADFSLDPQFGCPPLVVSFDNFSQFANTFTWSFGDNLFSQDSMPNHTYFDTGIYDVTLEVSMDNICFDEMTFPAAVTVYQSPIADFDYTQPNTDPNDGVVFFENLSSPDATSFYWDFGNGDTSTDENPDYRYYTNGEKTITLIVTNGSGCSDTIQKTLFLNNIKGLFIPNALSPDVGVQAVRVFHPKGVGLKTYHIRIYSSWGELLWESDKLVDGQPSEAWDGTNMKGEPMPQDVYTWHVTATFDDGEDTPWRGMPLDAFNKIIYQNLRNPINTPIKGYTRVGTVQILR